MPPPGQDCWKVFATTQLPEVIAKRIHEDSKLVSDGKTPSLTVYHLPKTKTPAALAIAAHLAPSPDLSRDTKFLLYENLLKKIRRYLEGGPRGHWPTFYNGGDNFLKDGPTWDASTNPASQTAKSGDENGDEEVTDTDLSVTLKVLQHLLLNSSLKPTDPISAATALLEELLEYPPDTTTSPPEYHNNETSAPTATTSNLPSQNSPPPPPPPAPPHQTHRKRLCYICRLALPSPTAAHPAYPCLCAPCGAYNLAHSALSTPPHLALPPTFTALVTGARVNLGYHVALRLLRCGARVIATTRYPRDAVRRYMAEGDAEVWRERLRVVGADFRAAADAFGVVEGVRGVLREWGGEERLDVLVNNAAQTLTDSVGREEQAVRREEVLRVEDGDAVVGGGGRRMLVDAGYEARVRGGVGRLIGGKGQEHQQRLAGFEGGEKEEVVGGETGLVAVGGDGASKELQVYTKSSWVQSLFEIPYEDVISAHAVNTFVPLILCRELLPLMGRARDEDQAASPENAAARSKKPLGYIVNVSSREGIFEAKVDAAKKGKHVHTNMSKAALNMITETEAATAWQTRRVAMNTVDPGYMSAAPEYEDAYDGIRPIGWEDGAGRVLWPIAMGEREGEAIWGRFLKHYGAVHVDPGVGRG
ncbi:putative short-chain dehydrogenase protein [Lasiodiplodia theobromae]|nr:putative short-chain dehydrogenase protein [Lasiodiplodia theobromae]